MDSTGYGLKLVKEKNTSGLNTSMFLAQQGNNYSHKFTLY